MTEKTFLLVLLLAAATLGVKPQQWPGEPKRILDFPTSSIKKIVVDDFELTNILGQDEIKDRKIVAASIVGPYRKGKSFMMDYFLRYLYFTYKSVGTSKNNFQYAPSNGKWIGLPDEPLAGFSWRSGVDRDTSGIVLWSDVFLYDDETSGEKFAIILIDTQGLFDHKTPQEINGKIFSFTTLMTSIQIFNLPNIIQEDHLEYLQFATEYAKFSISGNSSVKPFEHLLFLIRDWEDVDQYNLGFEGGHDYLTDKVLSTNEEQKPDMIEMRQSIKDSFDELSCFLLPHPGRVIKKFSYNGSWSALDNEFVDELQVLVPGLLSPEILKAKKINGADATVAEYLSNLKMYVDVFSTASIPSAQSVFESSVALYMDQLVKKFVSLYNEEMSQHMGSFNSHLEFENTHLKCKNDVTNEYMKVNKMGTANHSTSYQNLLIDEIDKVYVELKKTASTQIKNKILETQKKALEEELERMRYEESLPSLCIEDIRKRIFTAAEEKLNKISSEEKIKVIVRDVYNGSSSNFDLLVNFADHIMVQGKQQLIYECLVNEVKDFEHYPNMIKLIKKIKDNPKVVRKSESLLFDMRFFIINKLTLFMENSREIEYAALCNSIYSENTHEFVGILRKTVENAYGRITEKTMLKYLLASGNSDLNRIGTDILIERIKYFKDYDGDQFKLAQHFKQKGLNELTYVLNSSIKNIVFEAQVCIKNYNTNSYLYPATNKHNYHIDIFGITVNQDRRRVLTRRDSNVRMTEGNWIFQRTDQGYTIKSQYYNEYMYIATTVFKHRGDDRFVFCWRGSEFQPEGYWKIEPAQNGVNLYNIKERKYLSDTVGKYDRNSEGRHPYGSQYSDQWVILPC